MEGCKALPAETLATYTGNLTSFLKTAGKGNGELFGLLRALTLSQRTGVWFPTHKHL